MNEMRGNLKCCITKSIKSDNYFDIFVDIYRFKSSDGKGFTALPIKFKECALFEQDGEPAFSLSRHALLDLKAGIEMALEHERKQAEKLRLKSMIQEAVNKVCNCSKYESE